MVKCQDADGTTYDTSLDECKNDAQFIFYATTGGHVGFYLCAMHLAKLLRLFGKSTVGPLTDG